MKRRSKSRVFCADSDRDAAKRLRCSIAVLLFDMRLLVLILPPLAVLKGSVAYAPRSIIYAVIFHEVCSALSDPKEQKGWPPNQGTGHLKPMGW